MKYKNIANRIVNIKVKEGWVSVNPNEVVELDIKLGENSELEKVEIEEKIENLINETVEEIVEEEVIEETIKPSVSLKELKKMTIDEMNDFAAKYNLCEIKTGMKKRIIFKKLKEELGL